MGEKGAVMVSTFDSFDQSPLGAFIESALHARGSADLAGDIVVGGDFATFNGISVNRVAIFRKATGVWSALGNPGTSFVPVDFAIFNDELYACGGTASLQCVRKWNGSAWVDTGAPVGFANKLAVLGDYLYVARSTELRRFDGATWSAVTMPSGWAGVLEVCSDGVGIAISRSGSRFDFLAYGSGDGSWTVTTKDWSGGAGVLWLHPNGVGSFYGIKDLSASMDGVDFSSAYTWTPADSFTGLGGSVDGSPSDPDPAVMNHNGRAIIFHGGKIYFGGNYGLAYRDGFGSYGDRLNSIAVVTTGTATALGTPPRVGLYDTAALDEGTVTSFESWGTSLLIGGSFNRAGYDIDTDTADVTGFKNFVEWTGAQWQQFNGSCSGVDSGLQVDAILNLGGLQV